MNASSKIINNVQHLLDTYKSKLNDDKKLCLVYWQIYDGVEMNKEVINTADWLKKATSMEQIINAAHMINLMEDKNL